MGTSCCVTPIAQTVIQSASVRMTMYPGWTGDAVSLLCFDTLLMPIMNLLVLETRLLLRSAAYNLSGIRDIGAYVLRRVCASVCEQ